MNNYWELKKHEIKTGTSAPAEKKLENDLIKGLEDLKILEQKWQVQKLALEEDLNFLHQREMEIQTKVENLKRISNELSLFKNVKPDQYFHLHNGVVLKNLHDLIDVLEIIDDETFNHHVSGEKNDFSDWIMHVIKSRSLAEKIKKARTKEEMIEVLETEPAVMKDLKSKTKKHLPPKKYFWLSNGIVIKSLYELLDALKAMEQELFEEHVNKEKNDFSNWVMHTLKNKNLAEKLEKAKTRKEMVDILEIFL
jgi:mannitol/fructose-specific phosphotransferase system IIA component (Ntr-type)